MLAGYENHLPCPDQRGSGVLHGLGSGNAAGNRAVGQGFDEEIGIGRAAAGKGTGSIDQPFLQFIQLAAEPQILPEGGDGLLRYQVIAAILGHALAHRHGGIGHDADDGKAPPCQLPDALHGQSGGHGDQQGLMQLKIGLQGLQNLSHHVWLHGQENPVTGGRHLLGGSVADAQLLGQRLCPAGAIRHHDLLCHLAQGPGNGAAHVAAAQKTVLHNGLLIGCVRFRGRCSGRCTAPADPWGLWHGASGWRCPFRSPGRTLRRR